MGVGRRRPFRLSGGEIRREEVRSKLRILSLSLDRENRGKKTEKKREKNRGLLKKTRPRIFFFLLCFVCCRRIVTSSSRSFSLPHQIKEKKKIKRNTRQLSPSPQETP